MTYSRSALRQEVLVGLGIKRGLYQYLVHKEVEMDTSHFVSFLPLLPGDGHTVLQREGTMHIKERL